MPTAALTTHPAGPAEQGRLCGVCQCPIAAGEEVGGCPECAAPFHRECWDENGGCAVYGCRLAPQSIDKAPLAPQTYWGREEKECPRCGMRIKVAALRCRHCGEVFASAAPQTPAEYAAARSNDAGAGKRAAVLVFAAGILPLTAPVALAPAVIWYLARRRRLTKLPPTYRVLAIVGLLAAGLTTVFLALVIAAFGLRAGQYAGD